MTAPSLFDPPAPAVTKRRRRRRTADTSTDGLLDVQERTPNQRRIVLETLRACGPLTRHELADACALPLSSICGRVSELMRAGLAREVVVAGRRIRRDGRHVVAATYQTLTARAG